MFIKTLLLLIFVSITTHAFADNDQPIDLDNPRPLIMQPGYNINEEFQDQNKSDTLDQNGEANGDDVTDHCQKLKLEYDNLKGKGKPQRRWALGERYKVECQAYFDLHKGL